MIHVLAFVTAKPGLRATLLQHFRENAPKVRAEAGCAEYEAVIDSLPALGNQAAVGEDTFVVVEKWQSLADLEAHFKTPHMSAYAEKTRDLVASRSIHVLQSA